MNLKKTFDRHKVAVAVGIYDTLVGLWPLISMQSFSNITGVSQNLDVVRLLAASWLGLGLALLALHKNSKAVTVLGVMSLIAGAGLSLVELLLILKGDLSPIFLVQIAAESLIGLSWILTLGQGETVQDIRSEKKEAVLR